MMRHQFAAWAVVAGLVVTTTGASADPDRRGREPQTARRDRGSDDSQVTRDSRSFTVGRGSVLDLANIAGDVRITGRRGDTIRVDSVKRSDERRSARTRAGVEVEIRQVGNRVEVRALHSRTSRSSGGSVEFTVTVPEDAAVTAKSVSGAIVLSGVSGDVELESVSGNVEVAQAPNVALAKSVSGDVTARDIASGGTLTLGSVSGSIIATGLRVRALDAGTVSGDVRITAVEAQRVLAKTVSGNVEVAGAIARGGRLECTSHSGDIRLRLPAGAGIDLSADAHSGRIQSDFPVTLRGGSSRSSRAIRSVVGDGSTVVVVRSFSGNVTLTRE